MDPDERDVIFEDTVRPFLENPEDALWLFRSVRQRIKDDYPDLPLTQIPAGDGIVTRVTNENSRVEGNAWKQIRVITFNARLLIFSLGAGCGTRR